MFKQDVVDALKKKVQESNNAHDFEFPGAEVTEEEHSGGEGQGEHYAIVYKVTKDDDTVYVQVTGYYDSYDGIDWSYGSVEAVVPYQRKVRAWRRD